MKHVKRLPRDPGVTGWNAILPPPAPARRLEENIAADWLVVGGGFAGLSAARRLAQQCEGDRIVLVEAGRIGEGPAGRNSGFMVDLPHNLASENYAGAAELDRLQTELNRAAIDFAGDAAAEYGMPEEAFQRSGKVNGAAAQGGLDANKSYARHLSELGEAHEMLDATDMKRLTGSDFYLGGLFTPGTAVIHPAMYVRGFAEGLARQADVFEDTPVTAMQRAGGDWLVETPKGTITAPRVILGVNGHAESFGYYKRRLVHIHLYASMTRALTGDEASKLGGEPRWGVTPAEPVGSTVRRISGVGGTRIVVRNRISYTPDLADSEARVAAMGRTQDASFAARFPALAGIEMEYRWGGRLCLSLNEVPAFGEVEEGVFSACCQNGLGTARGTAAGMLAADLACGSDNPHLGWMLAHEQPKRLPPEPIARIGATATFMWREWRAGREV
ncbi:NAD(P)/FAD-dependent oxidoreductase [Oricola sp.]|uniref:NAD(P)/FAD-dependent oxidoreductase n=1 Tax=Oricola sp. TaxID=1979950 RepID=UPI003BA8BFD8